MSRIGSLQNGRAKRYLGQSFTVALATLAIVLILAACSSADFDAKPEREAHGAAVEPTDAWLAALQATPYPYLLPLPPAVRSPLDGTYAKFESKETPPVHCLRCPDYAPEGGAWKLNLHEGVFRIYHQATGWRSMGSFVTARDMTTAGAPDQLLLFNDPTCPDAVGLYAWRLEEGGLFVEVLDDTCAIHLRAMNLTNLPWLSCQPANVEAGVTDHWQKPPGCD